MLTLEALPTTASTTLLRADRISRVGNKWLGRLRLDQSTTEQLSDLQVGLFAEGFLGLETIVGRLLPMAANSTVMQTVVLYSSKEAGGAIYEQLANDRLCEHNKRPPEQWQFGNLLFSSIEGLSRLDHEVGSINTVILLDPTCMVYRARTMKTRRGRTHDRPQIVVDFLSDQSSQGLRPAFLLMTTKHAASLPTDTIARAFCLDAFWFLDGPSLVCR
jgi:hypothetical protein